MRIDAFDLALEPGQSAVLVLTVSTTCLVCHDMDEHRWESVVARESVTRESAMLRRLSPLLWHIEPQRAKPLGCRRCGVLSLFVQWLGEGDRSLSDHLRDGFWEWWEPHVEDLLVSEGVVHTREILGPDESRPISIPGVNPPERIGLTSGESPTWTPDP